MVSRLTNPMRFSLGNRTVPFPYDVEVEELEMRVSEGQLYVHWEPPVCDTCLGKTDEMHNWEHEELGIMWTCADHVPDHVDSEAYDA